MGGRVEELKGRWARWVFLFNPITLQLLRFCPTILHQVQIEALQRLLLLCDLKDRDVVRHETADEGIDLHSVCEGDERAVARVGNELLGLQAHGGLGEVADLEAHPLLRLLRVGERAFKNFLPLVQDRDACAEQLDFVEQVRGEQDGEAQFLLQSLNGEAHLVDALGVEAIAGLVEDEQLGVGHERLREGEPRAHAVGILAHLVVLAPGEADPLDDFLDALRRRGRGVVAEDLQILPAAEVVVKNRRLENRADSVQRLRAVTCDVVAADTQLAGGGPDLAEHHADGGALAGAVVAEEAEDLPAGHGEIELAHGPALAELLADASQLNHRMPPISSSLLMWPSA